jgi:hypothetical protein
MTSLVKITLRCTVALVAGAGCLLVSEQVVLHQHGPFATNAEARIGRPLTPLSYAGVARRTTRRAVAVGVGVGVAAGAAYAAPVVVAPAPVVVAPGRCVQAVDAYGRVYMRCY